MLAHELRWQLVRELLKSDLKVGELVDATGEAQNLVSYHLRLLREADLVRERRSSADGRDVYYTLDRDAVTDGLLGALRMINPSFTVSAAGDGQDSLSDDHLASVLFVCTGNSARSQIAEAMLRKRGGRRMRVQSAGMHPAGVHPQVHVVLEARNISDRNLRSKSVAEFAGQAFDYVVSLCDIARTERIEVGGKPHLLHWSIPDPVAGRGAHAIAKAFELVASEIEARVEDLYVDLRMRKSAA